MNNEDARYLCVVCGGFIAHERYKLGYKTCLQCGEAAARVEKKRKASMVQIPYAPINKSNYMYISDLTQLIPAAQPKEDDIKEANNVRTTHENTGNHNEGRVQGQTGGVQRGGGT
jgi:hypothetical protein